MPFRWGESECQKSFLFPGQRLVSPGSANETSSIMVESVTRSSTETCYSAIPKSTSDASKVVSRGAGLSKAFVGQKSSFSVDCSKAGKGIGTSCMLWCLSWVVFALKHHSVNCKLCIRKEEEHDFVSWQLQINESSWQQSET